MSAAERRPLHAAGPDKDRIHGTGAAIRITACVAPVRRSTTGRMAAGGETALKDGGGGGPSKVRIVLKVGGALPLQATPPKANGPLECGSLALGGAADWPAEACVLRGGLLRVVDGPHASTTT